MTILQWFTKHSLQTGLSYQSVNKLTRTFNVHKVAVWTLYKPLKFVLTLFFFHRGMQKIFE